MNMTLKTGTFLVLLSASTATIAETAKLADLSGMAGCWQDPSDNSIEIWLPPQENAMLGMAQSVRDGKVVFYERLMIIVNQEGALQYIAEPAGQKPTAFTLKDKADDEWVFSNPEHDFPTEIIYMLPKPEQNPAVLTARIQGMQNGELNVISFDKNRVACDDLFSGQ